MKLIALAATFIFGGPTFAQGPPKCPATAAITSVTRLEKLPAPVREALQAKVQGIVDSTQPFDATDVVQHGARFNRFAFAWTHDNQWIIATEHGGFVYSNPVYIINWKLGEPTAQVSAQEIAFRGDLCETVNSLYNK
jgi:hypothetical protein